MTWATTVSDALGAYPVTVRVTDDGDPAFEDTQTFSVILIDLNLPPVIDEIGDFGVNEGDAVLRTVVVTDPNQSTESLQMGLAAGAADGATFDPATMEFAWVAGEKDGPGTYSFTIWATDDGNPALSDAMTFVITVSEVNQPPVIQAIDDLGADRGTSLSFDVEVDDPDDPANALTFSLDAGAPAGAQIDPATGLFTWTLDETVPFGTYDVTVRVADDGSPLQEDTETFSVTVEPPMLNAIADQTVDEWAELMLTAIATDPYDPATGLSFSLDNQALLLGARIDPATGYFTWTPTEEQGPGSYRITIRLTDDADASISDSESFWVTVNEVSDELILKPIADVTLLAGAPLHVSLNASGSHANSLSYSISTVGTDLTASISDTNRSLQISVQNTGRMTFELFEDLVPRTTARIVELAQEGFYDGLIFHRVASYADGSPFVIQAGDPNGDGTGGSGLIFDDEFDPGLQHTSAGILSMANSGDDTNDSQFFVTADATRFLDFNHAVFGFQSSGDDVRQTIESVDVDAKSKPLSDVVINSISVFIDDRNGVLTLSAPAGASGEADVTITVSDGAGGVDSYTFHVTIEPDTGTDSDAPPYLLPITQIETTTNTPVEFSIPALDVEGDQIYYYGSVEPADSSLVLDVLELNGRATLTQTVPVAGVYALQLRVGGTAGYVNDSQMVPVFIRPGAPADIRLTAFADTGIDNADGITRLDNSADNRLEFIVSGTVPGAEVTLFADGEQIGQAVADGMSVTISTHGTYVLADGTHSITAVQAMRNLAVDVGNRHDTVDLIGDASQAFTITVDTVAPLFTSDPVTTAVEGVAYSYDAEADGAVQFSLTDSPAGMVIDPLSGVVSWTPLPSQGPSEAVSIRATDVAGNFVDQAYTVITTDTNQPPVLAEISDQTTAEGTTLSLTASATDPDVPADTLTYSLDTGFPSGAHINPTTGQFTWTPNESQSPGTHTIVVRVTDNGTPSLSDTETFTVTVTGTNQAPVLSPISDQTVAEGSTLALTAIATDPDIPADTLTYSLDTGFPSGAHINPTTGQFTWTPDEPQGPGTHTITVRVTDSGTPTLSDTETFTVTVTGTNQAPELAAISDQTIAEADTLALTATATDPDIPADTLTYSLDTGFPSGAQINSTTGQFTWTPNESQSPGTHTITVRVTDSGTPSLSDTETFTVTVTDTNQAPVLDPIPDQTIAEGDTLTLTASATDPDIPADTLTYSLDTGFPSGAQINPTTGQFTWTPNESQGPGSHTITVRVTDSGTPALFDTESFTVTVTDTNQAPVLAAISDQTIAEGDTLTLTATATDSDIPADTLTYSLDTGFPSGAQINPTTGQFTWTPNESQGPGTHTITVRVTDSGTPTLSDTETFTVTVTGTNQAPVLAAISDQTIAEAATLTLTATATDSDIPADSLTYSLDAGFPSGAQINPTTGQFTWTPNESQGPGTHTITVRVTDSGTPTLSDTETFTVTVTGTNQAPVLAAISDQTIAEAATLTLTATATDSDIPADTLTYSLDTGFPSGAQINPTTGQFTWTPNESQGPGSHTITVRVTDSGTPTLSDTETFTVTVTDTNQAPVLSPISDQTVAEGTTLTLTATATDSDIPADTLTYSLDAGFPSGAQINPTTGQFTWTPNESQGPGTHTITVRVTDSGTPALFDTETFTVTVTGTNQAPVLAAISDQTIAEGTTLTLTATATDSDIPADTLTYSLDAGFPSGAQINPTTGQFTWTPNESQGPGTHTITVRVTDSGTPALFDTETFTVTVTDTNQAPVLSPISDQTIAEAATLTLTASATDPDIPADTLTYSLDAGFPSGAQINPTTGQFTWTPDESQGPGPHTITVRVTDSGTPTLSDTKTFSVTVIAANQPPLLAPIDDRMAVHDETLSFTATAVDPGGNVTFSLDSPVPPGAAIDPNTGVFTWTPTSAVPVGWHQVTVRAVDDGSPVLSDTTTVDIKLMGRTTSGSIDLETLEFVDLPSYSLDGEARFSFQPARSGRVTLEAIYQPAAGHVNLTLLDSAGQVVATSNPTSEGRRIDAVLTAGNTYELLASGSHPAVMFRGANLLVDQGSTLDVYGTDDTDTFEIVAGSSHQLTINGLSYAIDPALTDTIIVNAAADDNVLFTGSAADETAKLYSASAILTGTGYTFQALGANAVAVDGGGGYDIGHLFDSPGNDTFDASPGSGSMTGSGFFNRLDDFDEVHGYSKSGGSDVAHLSDSPGDDEFMGKHDYSKLSGDGFYLRAKAFAKVYAEASAGGTDVASLVDGDRDETFIARPTEATMTGDTYFLSAAQFEYAHGYAREGGTDIAFLYDSPGDDVYKATPEYGKMTGDGFYNRAKFFEYTHGMATAGGHDVARFYDSPGDDTFIATPLYAKLLSDDFFLKAKFFEEVQARSSAGGNDLAELRDSTADDFLEADGNWAQLSNTELDFLLYAVAFGQVTAQSGSGDHDVATVTPAVDFLMLDGSWEERH